MLMSCRQKDLDYFLFALGGLVVKNGWVMVDRQIIRLDGVK